MTELYTNHWNRALYYTIPLIMQARCKDLVTKVYHYKFNEKNIMIKSFILQKHFQ